MKRDSIVAAMVCLLLTACIDNGGGGTSATPSTTPTPWVLAFATQVSFTTGIDPYFVALGDLNGDGKLDLAVPNFRNSSFSVMLNTMALGAATPSFATQVQFASGAPGVDDPYTVALGDVNGDGTLDVAVANFTSGTASVFLNQTAMGSVTPSFTAQIQFSSGSGASSVALGDVNGDGKVDLVVANWMGNTVSVLLNTTAPGALAPSFATLVSFAVELTPNFVALGDVNGDGKVDLAVTNFVSGTVSVLLNTTAPGAITPSFATQVPFGTGNGPNAVALGDVNGDGKVDLAVANWNSNTASVLLNTTAPAAVTPSFATQVTFTTGTQSAGTALGDVNGDGKVDLMVANFGSSTVSVLLNTTSSGATTPSFDTQVPFGTGSGSICVALGDVNGDGKVDLAVSNQHPRTVSVLLNESGPP